MPQIKLKYYKGPAEGEEEPRHADIQCFICGKINISIGSAFDAYSQNPKFACKDCTIERYRIEHGFKTREAAAARRRRIFDVSYLFNEMITDKYFGVG